MRRLVAIVVGLLAFPLTAAAEKDYDLAWSAPHAPYHIAGPVYAVGTEGIGVYLIATSEGHILVDGANESGVPVIEDNIRALGFALSDVKYIVQTHAHYDHVGGVAALKRDTGAAFVASEGDRYGLEHGTHVGDNAYGVARFEPIAVDRVIADGATVEIGGVSLKAVMTPGHSRGCTSWTLTVSDPEVAGGRPLNIMIFGSATTAGNVLVGNSAYPGIAEDYRATFAKLKAMQVDVFLPNHPFFSHLDEDLARREAGEADAFVDPAEFPAFVKESEAAFEQELAQQQAAAQ